MKKKPAPSLPPFTTVEEEAAILAGSAIAWRARKQKGPAGAAELLRRAAIYARWARVYTATEKALITAAAAMTPAPLAKPKKPANQAPTVHGKLTRGGSKNGAARRLDPGGAPATIAAVATPKIALKPPPARRSDFH